MKKLRRLIIGGTVLLLGAGLTVPALAAVSCGAVGEVYETNEGTYTYTMMLTWDFGGAATPDRIGLSIEHLMGCDFYDPQNPVQQDYIIVHDGYSQADGECYDTSGEPVDDIVWVGGLAMDDPDCWMPVLHLYWENTGSTIDCIPMTSDSGTFSFTSYGTPIDSQVYYGAIVIKAGEYCIVCDYEGPLPDCNNWAPIEERHWGLIKSLYK
jgi:hypothetical protein